MEIDELIACPLEGCTIKHTKKLLLHHLKFEYAGSENPFRCKINDCGRLYSSVRSFEKHLSRWHGSMLNQTVVSFDDSTVEYHADIGTGTINVQDFSGLIKCVDKTTQKKRYFC